MCCYTCTRPSVLPSAQDNVLFDLTTNPAARGGVLCHSTMLLKRDIENGHLKPLIIRGLIPLCSIQYERLFGTTRIPGQEAGTVGLRVSAMGWVKSRWVALVMSNAA